MIACTDYYNVSDRFSPFLCDWCELQRWRAQTIKRCIESKFRPANKIAILHESYAASGGSPLHVRTSTGHHCHIACELQTKSIKELFVFGSDSFYIPKDLETTVTPFRDVKGDKFGKVPDKVEINPHVRFVLVWNC